MGWLQNLVNRFRTDEQKANPVGSVIVAQVGGRAVWTPTDYKRLAEAGYESNAYVFACVNERSAAVSGIPWLLRTGTDMEVEIREHPLLDLLERPNPDQGGGEFWASVSAYHQLQGNSYTVKVGPNTGPPVELWNLRPDQMQILKGSATEPITGYQYGGTGGIEFDRDEILHLKSFHPTNDFYGLSPLQAAAKSIDSNNLAKQWNVATLQNSGSPSGAMVFKNSATKEQKERLRELMRDQTSGMGLEGWANAGRIVVMEGQDPGSFEFKPFSMTMKEMDWLQGQRLSAKEIAIAFNIPPELIGDTESKTYSNYQEARKAFYQENVLPFMDRLRDALNNWLTPLFGENLRLDYDRDSIEAIQKDRGEQAQMAISLFHAGLATKGEAREIVGLPGGVDDADLVVLPANVIPVIGMDALETEEPEPEKEEEEPEDPTQNEPDPPDETDEEDPATEDGQKSWDSDRRAAYFKQIDRQRNRFTMDAARTILDGFKAERKRVLRELRGATVATVQVAVEEGLRASRETWEQQLVKLYTRVGQPFAMEALEQLGARKAMAVGTETKADEDVWLQEALDYLKNRGLTRIKSDQITETTRAALTKAISEGLEEGEGIPQIAERISKAYETFSGARAVTIARTEVIAASNLGSLAAAKSTGLPIKKHWLATIGGNTREAHAAADGQAVGADEPFIVDGEELQFPGDSQSASAANIINCRCTLTHSVDRSG